MALWLIYLTTRRLIVHIGLLYIKNMSKGPETRVTSPFRHRLVLRRRCGGDVVTYGSRQASRTRFAVVWCYVGMWWRVATYKGVPAMYTKSNNIF
jgi:hypothetical protein